MLSRWACFSSLFLVYMIISLLLPSFSSFVLSSLAEVPVLHAVTFFPIPTEYKSKIFGFPFLQSLISPGPAITDRSKSNRNPPLMDMKFWSIHIIFHFLCWQWLKSPQNIKIPVWWHSLLRGSTVNPNTIIMNMHTWIWIPSQAFLRSAVQRHTTCWWFLPFAWFRSRVQTRSASRSGAFLFGHLRGPFSLTYGSSSFWNSTRPRFTIFSNFKGHWFISDLP